MDDEPEQVFASGDEVLTCKDGEGNAHADGDVSEDGEQGAVLAPDDDNVGGRFVEEDDQAYWTLLIFRIMRGSNSSANGSEPVTNAKRMTPRAQLSPAFNFMGMEAAGGTTDVVDFFCGRTSSGAQYASDPMVAGVASSRCWWRT